MRDTIHIRLRVLLALVLVAVVLTAPAGAQSSCESLDGTERECTVSEKWKNCMENTYDAYFQCLRQSEDESGSFGYAVDSTVCQMWLAVDQAACSVTMWDKTTPK